jgi:hypothetical protein
MEQGVVTEIAELATEGLSVAHVVGTVDGRTMSTVELFHVPVKEEPEPKPLQFTSLQALVDYVGQNRDDLDLQKLVVHVVSPRHVALLGPLTGDKKQRFTYAQVTCSDLAAEFLGKHHAQDAFVIGMQLRFTPTPTRADILKLISSLKDEQAFEFAEDGVTQRVSATKGVIIQKMVDVPNPTTLAPYRTFREVEQPESPFILRVKKADQPGQSPGVALFEADAGTWQLKAIKRVAAWLTEQNLGLPILS